MNRTIGDFEQVNGNITADELHVVETQDQRRHIFEQRSGKALGCPSKASKSGSAGRITKLVGVATENRFERIMVRIVSHDNVR